MEASLNGPLGRTALGQGALKIGRAPDNTLVINDPQSSAHHAEITPGFDGNSYQVTDLGSTNGTFVNEQRLTPHVQRALNPGDVIRIGSLRFTYEAGSGYEPTVMASRNNDQTVPSQFPGVQPTAYQQPPAYGAYNASQPALTPPPQAFPPPVPPQPVPPQVDYPQAAAPGQPGYPAPGGYSQPGYPPQGSYGQPGYPPAAPNFNQPGYPPKKKSRVGLWIGLIIVLLVIIGGIAGVVYIQNRSTPAKTLQAYCTALQNNDAQGIYNTLSSASQARTDVPKLSQGLQLIKLLTGGISGCSYTNVQENGNTATASLTLTPVRGRASTGTIHLINENGQWKLDETSSVPTS
jgi:hypothetical protein